MILFRVGLAQDYKFLFFRFCNKHMENFNMEKTSSFHPVLMLDVCKTQRNLPIEALKATGPPNTVGKLSCISK